MTDPVVFVILALVAVLASVVGVVLGPATVWSVASVVAIADVVEARRKR
jgi:hypothetical protein